MAICCRGNNLESRWDITTLLQRIHKHHGLESTTNNNSSQLSDGRALNRKSLEIQIGKGSTVCGRTSLSLSITLVVLKIMRQAKEASNACIWCFYWQRPNIFTNEDSRLRTVKLVQKPHQNWVHDAWLYWNCWPSKVQMIRNGPSVCTCWNACQDFWRIRCGWARHVHFQKKSRASALV